jgi:hypothetical protein
MKHLIVVALLVSVSVPALAQVPPDPVPEVATLVQLLREAQQREAAAIYRAIVAERRATAAEAKLASPKP